MQSRFNLDLDLDSLKLTFSFLHVFAMFGARGISRCFNRIFTNLALLREIYVRERKQQRLIYSVNEFEEELWQTCPVDALDCAPDDPLILKFKQQLFDRRLIGTCLGLERAHPEYSLPAEFCEPTSTLLNIIPCRSMPNAVALHLPCDGALFTVGNLLRRWRMSILRLAKIGDDEHKDADLMQPEIVQATHSGISFVVRLPASIPSDDFFAISVGFVLNLGCEHRLEFGFACGRGGVLRLSQHAFH